MTEEQIDPEDHHTREMYARYGLAMYFAQVVEAGIKNALVMAKLSSKEFATIGEFDESWAANFTVTLGRLVRGFKPYLAGDDALEADLQLALDLRNQLAHHFFWDHAADATTTEGRDRMIAECMATVEFFADISERLGVVVGRYSEAAGTPPEVFARRLAESEIELRVESEQASSRTCGRCLAPMEATGAERRPYWKCATCGGVALT